MSIHTDTRADVKVLKCSIVGKLHSTVVVIGLGATVSAGTQADRAGAEQGRAQREQREQMVNRAEGRHGTSAVGR